jgi:O-antigen/teichoic acid export membrane protein
MSPDAYGAWGLVLQISAYVGYLDFGIQTAVGRFVAYANEKGDPEHRDRIVSTSLVALSAAGVLGIAGITMVVTLLPHIFPRLPSSLLTDARVSLMLVASSLAIGLPASVFNGIFVGLQRYEVPASIIGASRIVGAVLLVFVVKHGGSLTQMGMAMAAVNLLSYGIQYLMYRKVVPKIKLSIRLISQETGRELVNYCLSLSIWTFATLLVTGLDILLVGVFDFSSVAYYTVAATLITFILGLQNAIFAVLIPSSAVLAARGRSNELGRILVSSTRLGMFLLLISGLPLLIAAKPILSVWVGAGYADRTFVILRVLVIANIIRLSALPYAMLLIGTGQQRLVTISPLIEGGSNLLVSIVAGALFGAVGVAIGTLIGSVVGIAVNFVYNIPRTKTIAVDLLTYLTDGLLRPLVCTAPLFVVLVLKWLIPGMRGAVVQTELFFAATLSTLFVFWIFGLTVVQRNRVLSGICVWQAHKVANDR